MYLFIYTFHIFFYFQYRCIRPFVRSLVDATIFCLRMLEYCVLSYNDKIVLHPIV